MACTFLQARKQLSDLDQELCAALHQNSPIDFSFTPFFHNSVAAPKRHILVQARKQLPNLDDVLRAALHTGNTPPAEDDDAADPDSGARRLGTR